MAKRERRLDNSQGWVAVAVALGLATILPMLILVTDIGKVLGSRAAAQRAVDAGALAGAYTFVAEPLSSSPSLLAEKEAMATVLSNKVSGKAISSSDVTIAVDTANRRVKVDMTHTEPTFLARMIGRNSISTAVTATAEADVAGTASKCVKPMFIPNWFLTESVPSGKDVKQDGYLDPSDNPCNSCPVDSSENPSGYDVKVSGNEWVHYDEGTGPGAIDTSSPSSDDEDWNAAFTSELLIKDGAVTTYAANLIKSDPPLKFTARVSQPGDTLAPSQYYTFMFPGYKSGNDYENFLWQCSPVPVKCSDCIEVQTGGMQAHTYDGLVALLDLNTSGVPDVFLSPGRYQHTDADGNTVITHNSVQLGLAPIWDPCKANDCPLKFDFCPYGEFPSGQAGNSVPIVGFAVVFIAADPVKPKSDVDVYLVDVIPCGSSPGSSVGPLAQPVRLVRTS